jgi:hypothetical protein
MGLTFRDLRGLAMAECGEGKLDQNPRWKYPMMNDGLMTSSIQHGVCMYSGIVQSGYCLDSSTLRLVHCDPRRFTGPLYSVLG